MRANPHLIVCRRNTIIKGEITKEELVISSLDRSLESGTIESKSKHIQKPDQP